MSDTWIIAVDGAISALVEIGKNYGGKTNVVLVGDAEIKGVDRVIRIPKTPDQPVETLAPAVVTSLRPESEDIILAGNTPGSGASGSSSGKTWSSNIFRAANN